MRLDADRRGATRIFYGGAPQDFGDLRLPRAAGPLPVVVVIHGGFWRALYDLEYIEPLCDALTDAGVATWNIEYRRLGNPGGGYPGTFHDVASAIDHLREIAPAQGLDLSRVATLGHSAGGHLAVWAAARHRIPNDNPILPRDSAPFALRAAISLAGVVDLNASWTYHLSNQVVEEFVGGAPAEFPERYAVGSPMELLPLGVKQVLVHGTEDENVPFEISRAYHAAALARGDDVTLITLRGAGHFECVDPRSREWSAVKNAVLSSLGLE
ncbi:MAG: alpha/beta hydrolase [Chloroflexota bacterium]|nr:alpha/beta hydrolase [Chloroflexota bacterium]